MIKEAADGIKPDGKLLPTLQGLDAWFVQRRAQARYQKRVMSTMFEAGATSAPRMAKFFKDAFKRKADAKRDGNPALAQVWKIIANSGYGFWGLRTADRDSILIQEVDKSAIYPYLESGKFLNYNESVTTAS